MPHAVHDVIGVDLASGLKCDIQSLLGKLYFAVNNNEFYLDFFVFSEKAGNGLEQIKTGKRTAAADSDFSLSGVVSKRGVGK